MDRAQALDDDELELVRVAFDIAVGLVDLAVGDVAGRVVHDPADHAGHRRHLLELVLVLERDLVDPLCRARAP